MVSLDVWVGEVGEYIVDNKRCLCGVLTTGACGIASTKAARAVAPTKVSVYVAGRAKGGSVASVGKDIN